MALDDKINDVQEGQPVTTRSDSGPREPVGSIPARAAGSIRRTSTIDVVRPEGFAGEVQLDGRARDLLTQPDGDARVVGSATLRASTTPARILTAITTHPARPALDDLVGASTAAGFRARATALVPADREARTPLYLLLDDLPVASLVSGYAMQRAGVVGKMPPEYRPTVDLCSGWRAGGVLMTVLDETGWVPMTLGPEAPSLDRADDPLAWHDVGPPGPETIRRRRRLDVHAGDPLTIDVHFRDTYTDPSGLETVVHEYSATATVAPDPDAFMESSSSTSRTHRTPLVITGIEATAHVLPYVECPESVASAGRLIGRSVDGLREHVRADFVGIATCTHLNDVLRSLADVGALADHLTDARPE